MKSNPKISRISEYLIVKIRRVDMADKDGLVLYTLAAQRGAPFSLVLYTLTAQRGGLFVVPVGKEADGREEDRDGKSTWLSRKRERQGRDVLGISVHTHASRFVYTYKYIYIYHTLINTYIHIYINTYIHVHIYIYIYMFICMHVHANIYLHARIFKTISMRKSAIWFVSFRIC